jgi:hypothetical protein
MLGYGLIIGGSNPGRGETFVLTTVSRPALGHTQPRIQCVPVAVSLGGKMTGAWRWPLTSISSAEVKECVELYLHSPNTPLWRGAQLKQHKTTLPLPLVICSFRRSSRQISSRFLRYSGDRKHAYCCLNSNLRTASRNTYVCLLVRTVNGELLEDWKETFENWSGWRKTTKVFVRCSYEILLEYKSDALIQLQNGNK